MRLLPNEIDIESGDVIFKNSSLFELPEYKMRKIRGSKISMVFQEPMSALNPVIVVGEQVREVLEIHKDLESKGIRGRVIGTYFSGSWALENFLEIKLWTSIIPIQLFREGGGSRGVMDWLLGSRPWWNPRNLLFGRIEAKQQAFKIGGPYSRKKLFKTSWKDFPGRKPEILLYLFITT